MKRGYFLSIFTICLIIVSGCSQTEHLKSDIEKNRLVLSDIETDQLYILDPDSETITGKLPVENPTNLASAKGYLISFSAPRNDWGQAKYSVIYRNIKQSYKAPTEPDTIFFNNNFEYLYLSTANLDGLLNVFNNDYKPIKQRLWKFFDMGQIKRKFYAATFFEEDENTLYIKDARSFATIKAVRFPSKVLDAKFYKKRLAILLKNRLIILEIPSFKIDQRVNFMSDPNSFISNYKQDLVYITTRNRLHEFELKSRKVRIFNNNFAPSIINKNISYGYSGLKNKVYFAIFDLKRFQVINKFEIDDFPEKEFQINKKIFFINDFGSEKDTSPNKLYIFDMKTNQLKTKQIGKELVDLVLYT